MNTVLRRVLAVFEVLGGIVGPVVIVTQLSNRPPNIVDLGVAALLCVPFLISLVAGVFLWRGTRAGRVLSVAVMVIQLPKVLSPDFAFMMSFGFDVSALATFRAGSSWFGVDIQPGAVCRFLVNGREMPVGFGVSLMSCFWLCFLIGFYRSPVKGRPAEPPESDGPSDNTAVDAFLKTSKAIQRAKEQH